MFGNVASTSSVIVDFARTFYVFINAREATSSSIRFREARATTGLVLSYILGIGK